MAGVRNGDGDQPRESFPGIMNPSGTGAPGTQGVSASTTTGETLATVGIRTPDGGMRDIASIAVHAGDTSAMSDDLAAHESQICPGPQQDYVSDGPKGNHTVSAADHARFSWQQAAR